MSSRHVGLDDGSSDCCVFGSLLCRYGIRRKVTLMTWLIFIMILHEAYWIYGLSFDSNQELFPPPEPHHVNNVHLEQYLLVPLPRAPLAPWPLPLILCGPCVCHVPSTPLHPQLALQHVVHVVHRPWPSSLVLLFVIRAPGVQIARRDHIPLPVDAFNVRLDLTPPSAMLQLVRRVLPDFMEAKQASRRNVPRSVHQGISESKRELHALSHWFWQFVCVFQLHDSAFCPPGSAMPSPCAAGSFSTAVSLTSSCTSLCGVGQFSTPGSTSCRDCYGGTIAVSTGTAHCVQCPEGVINITWRFSMFIQPYILFCINAGSSTSASGATLCSACATGLLCLPVFNAPVDPATVQL